MSDDQSDDLNVDRRSFLKASGAAGASAVAAGAGLSSAPAYALTLDTLTEHEGKTLLQMSRQMYPHDSLGDQYYGEVISQLDADADTNGEIAELIKNGVAELDAATSVNWVDLSDGYQLNALKAIQDTPFFQTVKAKILFSLYNNPLVWRHFGYEGEAFSQGGYLQRGFNDLNWLPEPPEDASPRTA